MARFALCLGAFLSVANAHPFLNVEAARRAEPALWQPISRANILQKRQGRWQKHMLAASAAVSLSDTVLAATEYDSTTLQVQPQRPNILLGS
jgi:hypothetical protein